MGVAPSRAVGGARDRVAQCKASEPRAVRPHCRRHTVADLISVNHDRWDARIARARELAVRHTAASEILTFYAQLAGFQQRLLGDDVPEPFASCIDRITEAIPEFLAFLTRAAPARLAESAALMREDVAGTEWRALIERYGNADDDADASPAMAFVVEALLQPFAEAAALALEKSKEADATPESGDHDPTAAASPRTGCWSFHGSGRSHD